MTGEVMWQTDDPCPICGTRVHGSDGADGSPLCQECGLCGWSVTWLATMGDAR